MLHFSTAVLCYVLSLSVAADDYQQLSETLDFPLGYETSQCVIIYVIDDDEVEAGPQMFQVVLTSTNSFLDIDVGAKSVLITIIDNDASGKIVLCASVFVQELNL